MRKVVAAAFVSFFARPRPLFRREVVAQRNREDRVWRRRVEERVRGRSLAVARRGNARPDPIGGVGVVWPEVPRLRAVPASGPPRNIG